MLLKRCWTGGWLKAGLSSTLSGKATLSKSAGQYYPNKHLSVSFNLCKDQKDALQVNSRSMKYPV